MSNESIVEAHGLVKVYRRGDHEIRPLDGLDMEVTNGEFLSLVGPSGSGKSTLLHMIGGLDKADEGTCRVGDSELSSMSERELSIFRAANVGFIFQTFNLVPILTAYENVELPLRLLSLSASRRREQVNAVLDIVGLSDRASHLPSQLSGGQEQRVAVARALVTDPRIVIADEPTGDLDEDSSEQVSGILRTLSSAHGKTIIMVTHDADMAARADRTLYFNRGRLSESRPESHRSQEGDR